MALNVLKGSRGFSSGGMMTSEGFEASSQILEDLIQLVAKSRQQSYEYQDQFGITVPQSGVLKALNESGSLPIGTLAERLMLKTSTVSGIVDRLERDGQVRRIRDSADRRVVHVALTAKGQSLCEILPGSSFDKVRRAISRLDPRDAQQFLYLLRQVMDFVNQDQGESTLERPVSAQAELRGRVSLQS